MLQLHPTLFQSKQSLSENHIPNPEQKRIRFISIQHIPVHHDVSLWSDGNTQTEIRSESSKISC